MGVELGYRLSGLDRSGQAQIRAHVFCPGFLRALAIKGDYAAVGLSKPRYQRFEGLDLQTNLETKNSEAWCGVQIVELKS